MKLQLIASILLLSMSISAQTYIDIPWRTGTILKKGKEIEGMIRLGGDLGAPWLNNSKVYFVTKEVYGSGKRIKKKMITEYSPKDLDGYDTYTTDADGNRVEMNYVTHEILLMGTIRKKKEKTFLRLVEEGTMNVYSYNPEPAKKIVTGAQERRDDKARALNQSKLFLKRGEADLILAVECELVEALNDCPEVVEKINNYDYGFHPKSKRPKRKGLGKFIANAVGDNGLESRIFVAIVEYNSCTR